MKKIYYFGKSHSKGYMVLVIIKCLLFSILLGAPAFKNNPTAGVLVFLIVFTIAFLIFGRFVMEDYWIIEENAIYYLPELYEYRRLFLVSFFRSEKHLLKQIKLEDIKETEIVWREITTKVYAIPMPICVLKITTRDKETVRLNIGLNPEDSTEAGEAITYLLEKGIIIDGADAEFVDYLLDPTKRLYDYYMKLKKNGLWDKK